jgi:hypothetical protein
MKRPEPEAQLQHRSALERHFLALAIVATAACAGTVIADAAVPVPAGHTGFCNSAVSVLFDERTAASACGKAP